MNKQSLCEDPHGNPDSVDFHAITSKKRQKHMVDDLKPQPIDCKSGKTKSHNAHGNPKGDHHGQKKHEQSGSEHDHRKQNHSQHYHQVADPC